MVCICCPSFCLPWWAWGSVALAWKGSSAEPGSSSPVALRSTHEGPGPGRRCLGDPITASASWAEPSSESLWSSHCLEVQCLLAPKDWNLFKQESWNSISRACRQMSPSKLIWMEQKNKAVCSVLVFCFVVILSSSWIKDKVDYYTSYFMVWR